MLRFIVITSLSVLAACASIPLSTMNRLGGFDEHRFAALDANDVRVRVSLRPGFGIKEDSCSLLVGVKSGERSLESHLLLEVESKESRVIPGGMFSASVETTAYVLRLTESSRREFVKLQEFVGAGGIGQIDLNVDMSLASAPKDAASAQVWVDLMLLKSEGYFPLVDGGSIPLNRTETHSFKSG